MGHQGRSVDSLQSILTLNLNRLDDLDLHRELGENLLNESSPVLLRTGVYHLLRFLVLSDRAMGDGSYGRSRRSKNFSMVAMRLRQVRERQVSVSSDLVIACCRRAVDLDPENAYGWSLLAQELAENYLYQEGLETGLRALALKEDDSYTHNALGKCYEGLRDNQRAATHYTRRAQLQNQPAGYLVVAEYLERMGCFAQAIEMLYEGVQLAPTDLIIRSRLQELLNRDRE